MCDSNATHRLKIPPLLFKIRIFAKVVPSPTFCHWKLEKYAFFTNMGWSESQNCDKDSSLDP